MNVKCITIVGENVIIAADQFDWLCEQAAKVKKLEDVAAAAQAVLYWNWSDCDDEPVADIAKLQLAVDAL